MMQGSRGSSLTQGISPSAGGNLAHTPSNDPDVQRAQKWDTLLNDTRELGALKGRGEDARAQHLMKVIQAAYEGVIDNTENKHGTGVDDATRIAEEYWKARNKSVIFDPKALNQRKTTSNIRSCITLGGWVHGGPGEPISMVSNAMTLYRKMRQEPSNAKRLIDAGNYLIVIATKMKRLKEVLSVEELRDMAFKKEGEIATIEDRLSAMRKELVLMRDGKHRAGGLVEADSVLKPLNRILKGIADAKRAIDKADEATPEDTAGVAALESAAV